MTPMDRPTLLFAFSLRALWVAARLGASMRNRRPALQEKERDNFSVMLGATLALLGLIIGFSFSMAISRYDQGKTYEEAEANAIGTEYLRADLLQTDAAAKTQTLLRKYLDQRVLFYQVSSGDLAHVNADTAELQNALWSAIRPSAAAQPTPIVGLVVSGMNDVLNSQGYTQAAWWNRIPFAAWALLALIAVICSTMVGYSGGRSRSRSATLLILPL